MTQDSQCILPALDLPPDAFSHPGMPSGVGIEVNQNGSPTCAVAVHPCEPVAIFTGEVLPLYARDLNDKTVRMLLNELASEIGHTLDQEEVHVGYRDRTWTLKRSQ